MRKIFEYLKKIAGTHDRKKLIENAAIVVIAGIIILIAGSTLFRTENTSGKEDIPENTGEIVLNPGSVPAQTKTEIETILSKISGAGRVSVMITYQSSAEKVPAYDVKKTENKTQEKDSGGGTRNINQEDYESKVVYEDEQGGAKNPVIVKEIQPTVKGVVVVADGAADAVVREKLSRAVQVLLDVPIHRIQVLERKK